MEVSCSSEQQSSLSWIWQRASLQYLEDDLCSTLGEEGKHPSGDRERPELRCGGVGVKPDQEPKQPLSRGSEALTRCLTDPKDPLRPEQHPARNPPGQQKGQDIPQRAPSPSVYLLPKPFCFNSPALT
ncbi:hypothetical protein KUCAC02_034643 [Chaenocephalus aceratus]|nr:hypothetical protein KUCAC02_034643 [Chaenocephalus aceratus]